MILGKDFKMKTEYWEFQISSGTADKLTISITFFDKQIPDAELRKLEAAIRLLLQACGRLVINPSKR